MCRCTHEQPEAFDAPGNGFPNVPRQAAGPRVPQVLLAGAVRRDGPWTPRESTGPGQRIPLTATVRLRIMSGQFRGGSGFGTYAAMGRG